MPSYSASPARRPARPVAHWVASAAVLVVFLLVLTVIAVFEGIVSGASASGWFGSSAQVVWTPPRAFSRIVWAVVFLLLAVAGWSVWRRIVARARARSRALYVIALALLVLWPPVYLDGYPLIGAAALWIAFAMAFLLAASVAVLAATVWGVSRTTTALLIPVAAWVLYVATINFGDAVLASLG